MTGPTQPPGDVTISGTIHVHGLGGRSSNDSNNDDSNTGKSPAPPFVNQTVSRTSVSHTTVTNHTVIDTVITTVTNNQTNTTQSTDINGNPDQYPWASRYGIPGAPGAAGPGGAAAGAAGSNSTIAAAPITAGPSN